MSPFHPHCPFSIYEKINIEKIYEIAQRKKTNQIKVHTFSEALKFFFFKFSETLTIYDSCLSRYNWGYIYLL